MGKAEHSHFVQTHTALSLKFPRNRENIRISLTMMEHEFRESSGVLYVGVWLDVPGYLVRPRKVRAVQRAKLISLKGGGWSIS